MRMLLRCSLLGLSLAGLLAAQHGGRHSGGGHSSGGGNHLSAGRSFSGYSGYNSAHIGSGFVQSTGIGPSVYTPGGYRGNALPSGIVQSTGIGPSVYNSTRSGRGPVAGGGAGRNRRYGAFGVPVYPYLGYGYYDGFGDSWDNSYDYAAFPEPDRSPYLAVPDPNVEQGLPNYYYPPIPYAMDPPAEPTPAPPPPPSMPITLVLRDGRKLEVQNYAIMNGVFWDFSKQNAKKIPFASIDEAASAKATEDAGGSFPEEAFATNPR